MINPKRKKGPPKKTGTVEKRMFYCTGGPFDGAGLCLESTGTLPIKVGDQVGRYVPLDAGNGLKWVTEQTQ